MALAAAAATILSMAAAASAAGGYKGYGSTGYEFDRKRDCCEEALLRAADDSAGACRRAGKLPDYDPRRLRGSCKSEWRQDGRGTVWYACESAVSVPCR